MTEANSAVGCGQRLAAIRALNDGFRQRLPRPTRGCHMHVTRGLGSLTIEQFARLLQAVSSFAEFSPDNDPYGEHDFGSLAQDGETYFWKIDAYDLSMQCGSPDPTDPALTIRVLTLMRADEY